MCAGNSPVTDEFHAQKPVTRSFDVFYGWVNNREAGDLRRHRAHFDVTVMEWWCLQQHYPYFHLVVLLLQYVALFQSREQHKY